MISKSFFVLLIAVITLVILKSSHGRYGYGYGYRRNWRGGRNRGYWGRGYGWNKPRYGYGYGHQHCVARDIIPCAFLDADQKVLEQRQCPPSFTCTNGPLQIQINGTAKYFRFCNVPFSATTHLAEACREEYLGGWISNTKTCPGGQQCNGGPIYADFYSSIAYYFCGNTAPTAPNYDYALVKKACYMSPYHSLGCYPVGCGWYQPCAGEMISLVNFGVNITMKLCSGPTNPGFYYLNAFGPICTQYFNGNMWSDPGVTVPDTRAGGTPTTAATTTPKPTTVDPNKDGEATGENLPPQGLP